LIDTGLAGDKAKDILDSVIGQMSDGMWENSPKMEHYWPFISVEMQGTKVYLSVCNTVWKRSFSKDNWFKLMMNMNESAIKNFMADKLKAVAKEELKDNPRLGKWDRGNIEQSVYLSYDIPITFQEIYFVYEILKERVCQRKYPEEVVNEMMY
jgi:hypothetical protein